MSSWFKQLDVLLSGDYYTRCAMCWKEDHIGLPKPDGAVCNWHLFADDADIYNALKEAGVVK